MIYSDKDTVGQFCFGKMYLTLVLISGVTRFFEIKFLIMNLCLRKSWWHLESLNLIIFVPHFSPSRLTSWTGGVCGLFLKGKPSGKKSVYVWIFFQTALTPPLYFCNASRNFLKPHFIWTKVPQSVWILVLLPHFPWKMSNQKQKKVPHHLWNQATPPPSS